MATYIHNRTPTKALGGCTLYEVLYGVKPDVSPLCAFGMPCTIVKPNKLLKLKKLDDRTMMFFLLDISTVGQWGLRGQL